MEGCGFDNWTDWFKAPDEFGTCLLVWGRVPSFVIIGLGIVLALSAWRAFFRQRREELARIRGGVVARTTSAQRTAVGLVFSAVVVLLATYVLSRLAERLFERVDNAPSIFDRMFADADYPVGNPAVWIAESPHWTYVTGWAVVGSAAVAVLMLYGYVTRTKGIQGSAKAIVWLVCAGTLVLGGLCVIAALGNGLLEDGPNARPLALFYGVWAAAMFALLWGWIKFEAAVGRLYA